ncbi:MAG: HAD-IA family hydrolase [Chloroflexota bacterium]|nr:HAD-IA family hydrolase [Chloroflexota bacterium]MDE2884050.1 HAD-IA family hydrolase [Chloroflexota bacterium]
MNREIIVALDAMGVIYQPGADVDELVIPFVRERGCTKADAEIVALYNDASLGLLSTRELWTRLDVAGDPEHLDRGIAARYTVTDGLHDFLRWCGDAGLPVACISNDVSEWATLRARHFRLSDAIASWTISGDVGARKPDAAIYEAFLSAVSPHTTCVFVDDRPRNVAAAASRGMHGVLFGPGAATFPQAMTVAADFAVLKGLIQEMRADSSAR